MINLDLIDLYLKGIYGGCAFVQTRKYQNIFQLSAKFC